MSPSGKTRGRGDGMSWNESELQRGPVTFERATGQLSLHGVTYDPTDLLRWHAPSVTTVKFASISRGPHPPREHVDTENNGQRCRQAETPHPAEERDDTSRL